MGYFCTRLAHRSMCCPTCAMAHWLPQLTDHASAADWHCLRSGLQCTDQPAGAPVQVTLKLAGVHWWFQSRAHAAELTSGYFNAGDHDAYQALVEAAARFGAGLTLTCVEMCDSQHPPEALCSPEGLLRQASVFGNAFAALR